MYIYIYIDRDLLPPPNAPLSGVRWKCYSVERRRQEKQRCRGCRQALRQLHGLGRERRGLPGEALPHQVRSSDRCASQGGRKLYMRACVCLCVCHTRTNIQHRPTTNGKQQHRAEYCRYASMSQKCLFNRRGG